MSSLDEIELVALVRYPTPVVRAEQEDGSLITIHEWRFRVRLPDGTEHDLEQILWKKATKDLPLVDADGTDLGTLGSRQEFAMKMAALHLAKVGN